MNITASIAAYLDRLAPRERILLGVASVTGVLLVLYAFVWDPLQQDRAAVAQRISRSEASLAEMQGLRGSYFETLQRIEANQAAIASTDERFNLFSYVQSTVRMAVSADRISSMNPSTKEVSASFVEERVEIKLNQIGLESLVDLIYRIEKGTTPLRFSRMQIKKRRDDIYAFDVTATVSVLKATVTEGES